MKHSVMVVDDSRLERYIIHDFLAKHGYNVIEVTKGKDTLLAANKYKPDLIILDLFLENDLNGIDICRDLKRNNETRLIPVIIVTAYGDKKTKIEGLEAGADDFLTKPIDEAELAARVKSLLKVKAYYEYAAHKDYYEKLELQVREKTAELESILHQLKIANNEISQAYRDSLYRLSVAAEYRDDDTGGHIKRISHFCEIISEQLGMDRAFIEDISDASPLHDIGKIGIPDHVLLKPGKLNSAEWDVMRNHTIIGAKILSDSEHHLLETAQIVAISHHEKYDGTGYPYGLKGDKIPLVGRIVAVADVFDALNSKRVYKPAFTLEESLRIMRDSVGTHFDPEIANAFFKSLDRINESDKCLLTRDQEYYFFKEYH